MSGPHAKREPQSQFSARVRVRPKRSSPCPRRSGVRWASERVTISSSLSTPMGRSR